METLVHIKSVARRSGELTLTDKEIAELLTQVPEWKVVERDGVKCLEHCFTYRNFAQALAFTNRVGELAETEEHHPAILTEWGKVTVTWWTHKVKGLHRNDFIMAVKTSQLYSPD